MNDGLQRPPRRMARALMGAILAATLLDGCASDHRLPSGPLTTPEQARDRIAQSLPASLADRPGWTADLYAGFRALAIEPSRANVCAVVAVIAQESSFRVDPVVPNLPAIAWAEIDQRAAHAGVPLMVVHTVLKLSSPTGATYAQRIDHAQTEKQLSDIYEDFIGAVPLGRTLFADDNPIRTRGPMQVHKTFAETFAASHPYPYPVAHSIADEVFTRRGGLYFGIAHLLAYSAPYDRFLYRFADFNAGQYASRNAAFQHALGIASGIPVVADGALVPHAGDDAPGGTELAARSLGKRLDLGNGAIHDALDTGKSKDFEQTALYQRVFELAERLDRTPPARAWVPTISLRGPKITRNLTTAWYANRVDQRFERCLQR